jgi:hypothetical protein
VLFLVSVRQKNEDGRMVEKRAFFDLPNIWAKKVEKIVIFYC